MPRTSRVLLAVLATVAAVTEVQAQAVVAWQRVQMPGYGGYISLDTLGVPTTVAGQRDSVFSRLRETYRRLQVRLDLEDKETGMLGALRLTRTQTFAGTVLSRVVDCGPGAYGSFADNARVQLALVTFVAPAGADSTLVRTALIASAQPVDGAANGTQTCRSTGFVENQILRDLGGGRR